MRSYAEGKEMDHLGRLYVEADDAKDKPDEQVRIRALMDQHFESMCNHLAPRVVRWNWTNAAGLPIVPWNDRDVGPNGEDRGPCARLSGDPEVLKRLSVDELYWLLNAHLVKTRFLDASASGDSPTSSEATTSETTMEPSPIDTGRSPTKERSATSAKPLATARPT